MRYDPAVPPVCVKLDAESDILDGLFCDVVVGDADRRIMFPALSPLFALEAEVLIDPAAMAVEPVPPDEMKTDPPRAAALDDTAEACAEMEPVTLMAPEETSETGPAMPFKPVESVVIFPETARLTAGVLADEFTISTSPP